MPPAEEAAERYLRARCRNKMWTRRFFASFSAALQRRGFFVAGYPGPLRRLESRDSGIKEDKTVIVSFISLGCDKTV